MCRSAGPLHGFSCPFPQRQSRVRDHLVEGVPARLSELLLQGELDLTVTAQPEPFHQRLDLLPLYRERFCIAFPTGHRFQQQNRVGISDIAGDTYLRRINCEYREYLADRLGEYEPVSEPEVVRVVSLVSVAGRRFSPAGSAFIRAIRTHDWARDPNV
jgi:DNA-binding transcriptional LysR family regulator